MLKSIKNLFNNMISSGIYDLIKYLLLGLIASISGFIYNLLILDGKYLVPFTIIITITCIIVTCLLILVIYKENNPIFNIYKKTDFPFVLLEKELTYDYTSLDCIRYEKNMKLKVICPSVDRFFDKYNWTGDSKPVITSSNKTHIVVPTPKRDSYETFEVHFGRTYKKGDIIDFKLIFLMEDKGRKSETRVSTTIDEPIINLKINIKVSEEYRGEYAIATIFPIIDGRHSLYNECKYFDNSGVIEWEAKDPQMLTKYALTWSAEK